MSNISKHLTELMLMASYPFSEFDLGTYAVTTHAPHPACPHMIFVPVKDNFSRKYRARLMVGETSPHFTEIKFCNGKLFSRDFLQFNECDVMVLM